MSHRKLWLSSLILIVGFSGITDLTFASKEGSESDWQLVTSRRDKPRKKKSSDADKVYPQEDVYVDDYSDEEGILRPHRQGREDRSILHQPPEAKDIDKLPTDAQQHIAPVIRAKDLQLCTFLKRKVGGDEKIYNLFAAQTDESLLRFKVMTQVDLLPIVFKETLYSAERLYLLQQYFSWDESVAFKRLFGFLKHHGCHNQLVEHLRDQTKDGNEVSEVFRFLVEFSGSLQWNDFGELIHLRWTSPFTGQYLKERELILFSSLLLRILKPEQGGAYIRTIVPTALDRSLSVTHYRALEELAVILKPYFADMSSDDFSLMEIRLARMNIKNLPYLSETLKQTLESLKEGNVKWFGDRYYYTDRKSKTLKPVLVAVVMCLLCDDPKMGVKPGQNSRSLNRITQSLADDDQREHVTEAYRYGILAMYKQPEASRPELWKLWLNIVDSYRYWEECDKKLPRLDSVSPEHFLEALKQASGEASEQERSSSLFISRLRICCANQHLISKLDLGTRQEYVRKMKRLVAFLDQYNRSCHRLNYSELDILTIAGTPSTVLAWNEEQKWERDLYHAYFLNAEERGISVEDGRKFLDMRDALQKNAGFDCRIDLTAEALQQALQQLPLLVKLNYKAALDQEQALSLRRILFELKSPLRESLAQVLVDVMAGVSRHLNAIWYDVPKYLELIPYSTQESFFYAYLSALSQCLALGKIPEMSNISQNSVSFILKSLQLFPVNQIPMVLSSILRMGLYEKCAYLYREPSARLYEVLKWTHSEDRLQRVMMCTSIERMAAAVCLPLDLIPNDIDSKSFYDTWGMPEEIMECLQGQCLSRVKDFWAACLERHTSQNPAYGLVTALYKLSRRYGLADPRSYFPETAVQIHREYAMEILTAGNDEKEKAAWCYDIIHYPEYFGIRFPTIEELEKDPLYARIEPVLYDSYLRGESKDGKTSLIDYRLLLCKQTKLLKREDQEQAK